MSRLKIRSCETIQKLRKLGKREFHLTNNNVVKSWKRNYKRPRRREKVTGQKSRWSINRRERRIRRSYSAGRASSRSAFDIGKIRSLPLNKERQRGNGAISIVRIDDGSRNVYVHGEGRWNQSDLVGDLITGHWFWYMYTCSRMATSTITCSIPQALNCTGASLPTK